MVLWLLHEQWITGYNDLEFNLKTPCTLAQTNLSCVNVWAYWKKVNVFETVHFSNFCTLQFWVIPSLNIGNKKQLGPSISFVNVFGILLTLKVAFCQKNLEKIFTSQKIFRFSVLNLFIQYTTLIICQLSKNLPLQVSFMYRFKK